MHKYLLCVLGLEHWSGGTDCMYTDKLKSSLEKLTNCFGELTRCSQNMSCEQCEVSKCLVYRHILKSILKKLEEKNQKFSFFGTWINFNQVCSSHAICHAAHPCWCQLSFFSPSNMKQPMFWQPVSRIKWRHYIIIGCGIMTLYLCTKRSLFHQEDHLISRISYSRDN